MRKTVFDVKTVERDYKFTSGTIKAIAERYGIKFNTLRSYIYRHNWHKCKRTIKRLDRYYNPSSYSDIPYKAVVFAIMVGYYGWQQDFAYYHCYLTKPETSRVNAYRLLRNSDIKKLIYKCQLARVNKSDLLKYLPIKYCLASLDAKMLNDRYEFWTLKFGYNKYCLGGSNMYQNKLAFSSINGFL